MEGARAPPLRHGGRLLKSRKVVSRGRDNFHDVITMSESGSVQFKKDNFTSQFTVDSSFATTQGTHHPKIFAVQTYFTHHADLLRCPRGRIPNHDSGSCTYRCLHGL